MVAAADRCVADAPNRAVAMLVDAAAWKLLAGELLAAETVVQRADRPGRIGEQPCRGARRGDAGRHPARPGPGRRGAGRAEPHLAADRPDRAVPVDAGGRPRRRHEPRAPGHVAPGRALGPVGRALRGRQRRRCAGGRAVPAAGLGPPRRGPAGRRRRGRRRRCRPGRAARQRRRGRLGLVGRHAAPRAHRRPPARLPGLRQALCRRRPGGRDRPGCGPCRRSPCSSSSRVGSVRRWRGSAPSRTTSPTCRPPTALRPASRSTSSRPRSPRRPPPSSSSPVPPSAPGGGPLRRPG